MKIAQYGSSLTDAQWEYLQPMLPKGGSQWRYLPADLPPWQTVYGIFRRWKLSRFWAALNDALRILVRKDQGRRPQPTAAVLDSQSVKSAGHGGPVGYDAGKRIKGRKRHLLVDILGLVLGVVVTPADTTERDGGEAVLGRVGPRSSVKLPGSNSLCNRISVQDVPAGIVRRGEAIRQMPRPKIDQLKEMRRGLACGGACFDSYDVYENHVC
jgi:putative transposase